MLYLKVWSAGASIGVPIRTTPVAHGPPDLGTWEKGKMIFPYFLDLRKKEAISLSGILLWGKFNYIIVFSPIILKFCFLDYSKVQCAVSGMDMEGNLYPGVPLHEVLSVCVTEASL